MRKITHHLAVILFATLLISCGSDDENVSGNFLADVIVVNEGNFSNADGSVTGYNISLDSVTQDLFEAVNGFSVTATIQNIVPYNDQYYIIANNPSKVEVTHSTFSSTATITDEGANLSNPFDFAAKGTKGYISNWGSYNESSFSYENSFIAVVDLTDHTISKKINLENQPQDLLVYNNKLYVTNVSASSVSVIDTNTDEVVETISTPFGPDKMVVDRNNKIWVICNSGALVKIDPSDNSVEQTIDNVVTSGFNEKFVINNAGDKLYNMATVYSSDYTTSTTSVYEFAISDSEAPSEPLIVGETFYGLGIDNDIIFVGDHNGFQGTGTVYLYDLSGNKTASFESGIAPNGFIFR